MATMDEMVLAVQQHANSHYEDGGWDVIVECWSYGEILEHLVTYHKHVATTEGAIEAFAVPVSVWADRQADAKYHRQQAGD